MALQWSVGFSLGMVLLLGALLIRPPPGLVLPKSARLAGLVMLVGLALTQLAHLALAAGTMQPAPARSYVVVLSLQSLGFYGLLLGALRPDAERRRSEWLLPLVVLAVAAIIPLRWAIPVALILGSAAAVHLAVLVHRLRSQRRAFALELKVLALFAAMGVVVAVFGLRAAVGGDWPTFAQVYAASIALGFLVVGWLLLSVPDLWPKTREAVAVAYARSTLGQVDRAAALARLRDLFEREQVHRDESLKLGTVADMLGLSSHQLSELVNTEFGAGFSRFVRRHRVETARRMLLEEPRASVLSVGLASGFTSQSSFYVAFREVLGEVPGEYRQRRLDPAPAPD